MTVNDELYNEISEYCELNNIKDVNKFIHKLIKSAFTIEKYGNKPNIVPETPKEIHIEEPIEEPIVIPVIVEENNIIYKEKKDMYGE